MNSTEIYSIKQIPENDRPRERLLFHGPDVMSTAELIAVILGSGTKEKPVLQLAQEIVSHFGHLTRLSEATVEEFCQIKGIGVAKAIQLRAALSLGKRASHQTSPLKARIESPTQAYYLVKSIFEQEKRELVVSILRNIKGGVIRQDIVAIGTLTRTLIHPREVFYFAIRHKAASIILVRNHPSGDPSPSAEDFEITDILIEAGKLMRIPLHDHLIVGDGCFVSLREKGVAFE